LRRLPWAFLAACALASASLAACSAILGFQSSELLPDASATREGGFDVMPLPACGKASQCVPHVPPGWSGPLAVARGASAASCPEGFSDPSTTPMTFIRKEAEGTTCGSCICTPGDIGCAAQIEGYSGGDCDASCGEATLTQYFTDSCQELDPCDGSLVESWEVTKSAYLVSQCFPSVTDAGASSPNVAVLCQGMPEKGDAGCGAGSCLTIPSGFFAPAACIEQNGDHVCPGAFPFAYEYGQGVGCDASTCACGDASGATCPGKVVGYDNSICSAPGSTADKPARCVDGEGAYQYFELDQPLPVGDASCPPMGTPRWDFTGQVTVCCTGPV
jgi:hypothetical protein